MIPDYVNDIRRSLENKCYYSALALTLALPDICGYVEYPEKNVFERYTEWYDEHIGNNLSKLNEGFDDNHPWLSGEMVYNLRNTYLHQGEPRIVPEKVKEPSNQLDRFLLVLGDGTIVNQMTFNLASADGSLDYKMISIDITYLCELICVNALQYYEENRSKFRPKVCAITQEELMRKGEDTLSSGTADPLADLLNRKLEKQGSTKRVVPDPERFGMLTSITPMNCVMKCDKCNGEMEYFREGSCCGWKCSNCGWEFVTTYSDPMDLDEQLYSINLFAIEVPKAEIIMYFSKIKGCNFLDGKVMLNKGTSIDNLKAWEVKKIISELNKMEIAFEITPEFPYYD